MHEVFPVTHEEVYAVLNRLTTLKTRICFALLVIGLLSAFSSSSLVAQSKPQWAPIQRIPGYDDETKAPLLVADNNRTIHAFNVQPVTEDLRAIHYSTWSADNGWSKPNDIIAGPSSAPQLQDVILDQQGVFHLIYFGGNDVRANIFYTYAPAIHAGNAHAWAEPFIIGPAAASPAQAQLRTNSNNELFVVYSGRVDGPGLYAIESVTQGGSWSEPLPIYLVYTPETPLAALYTTMDDSDRLHVVWTDNNISGNGELVSYVQLDTITGIWSTPEVLATAERYESDWPSIAVLGDTVIVVYQNSGPATRWVRVSQDGGQTWGHPVRPFQHVGEYGHAALATDSAGDLHMILGNRLDSENHGMWYSKWEGNRWRPLKAIVSGPVSKVAGEGFDPHKPYLVVSQGNLLFAAWSNDHGFNGGWFSDLSTRCS